MTPAEKSGADRLAALHVQLTKAVEDLACSDAWHRMLEIAARMPTYSPSNVLLIAVQRPDATRVAGFRAWKQLGRNVLKGEKGIAILAPCLYRGRVHDENPTPPTLGAGDQPDRPAPALRGFRIVHVFDISQTDGQPLPDVNPTQLSGSAPVELWERLAALVEADGFALERGDCHGAGGYTNFDDRVVRIRDDVDPAQAVKTLAHELGHIRADHGTRFAQTYHQSGGCRGIAEVEAESIAYLVTSAAGMDTGDYSVPYVTGWARGDADLLRDTATRVLATAGKIHQALPAGARDRAFVQPPAFGSRLPVPLEPRHEPSDREGLEAT